MRTACAAVVVLMGIVRGAVAAEPSAERVREALAKAVAGVREVSTSGGYLWAYAEDLKERWGEGKATVTQVWVQPPGTPAVGMALLHAYRVTKEAKYPSAPLRACLEAAEEAAIGLRWGQLESGGWDYKIDFDKKASERWYRAAEKGKITDAEVAKKRNNTIFDDDNTQSALRFLMAVAEATGGREDERAVKIRGAMEYGLKKMLEAQYPNGAWPQRWDGKGRDNAKFLVKKASIPQEYPRQYPKVDYSIFYTLNDNTQRDCILTMLEAHRKLGKKDFLEAAKRGGDFLILAQLPGPQAAWAQQYNANMEPAWARAFEPPAVCSGESAGVVRMLVELYLLTGEEKYLGPIPAAVEWFKRSQIRPGMWARFYELGTNKPIYGDRDGKIHYTMAELTEERRTGYSWESEYGVAGAIGLYEEVKRKGREKFLEERARKPVVTEAMRRAMGAEVERIMGEMDGKGRWVTKGRIEMKVFIANVTRMCEYLEMAGM